MATERFTVLSKDGVEISVQKAGSGPALLLIHGALLNGPISWGACASETGRALYGLCHGPAGTRTERRCQGVLDL